MRVISQDGSYSVDFDGTVFRMQNNIIYAMIGKESIVFGRYDTIERTKDVFIEIHKANLIEPISRKYIYHMPEG